MFWNNQKNKEKFLKVFFSISTKFFFITTTFSILIILCLLYLVFFFLYRDNYFLELFLPNYLLLDIDFAIIYIFSLIIFLLVSYYFLSYIMLSPFKKIKKGIEEIAKGNLKFQFKSKRRDEFGSIMESFNTMSENIYQQLEARKQLLLDLSHELKTPLTRAKLSLENLPKNKNSFAMKEDLQEISYMIQSILDSQMLTKEDLKKDLQQISVKKVVVEVVEYYQKKTNRIKLKNDLPNKKYFYHKHHLKILLNNFIENALHYSTSDIFLTTEIKNDNIVLKVADQGVGIAKEELAKITTAFYQVNKSRSKKAGSYGLGLNICQRILEAYGGKLVIESELKKGTLKKGTLKKGTLKTGTQVQAILPCDSLRNILAKKNKKLK